MIALSGDSGGNAVRIGFSQFANNSGQIAPFVEIGTVTGAWTGTVCFSDVTCPSWASASMCSITGQYYDLQIQVVGGEAYSDFYLCLDAVVPM